MPNPSLFDLRKYLRGNARSNGVWIALAALIVFGLLRYENFGSAYNIASFLNYNSMFILIAIGMCFVIMTGGIDLSVGSVAAFASVVAAYLSPYGLQVALPGGVLAGLGFGAIHAFVIIVMRVPPFIATLAGMLAAKGGALVLSGAKTIGIDWGSNFTRLGMETAFGVLPWTIVVVAVVTLGAWCVLERTSLGRSVLAIGDSEEASTLMGLRVKRAKVFVYLFSGGCAGLAGVILASGFGAGQPLEGLGWELAAIASVVVGGTLLTGRPGIGSGDSGRRIAAWPGLQHPELRERAWHNQPECLLAACHQGRLSLRRHSLADAIERRPQAAAGRHAIGAGQG